VWVERRVAVLHEHPVARLREKRSDDVAARPFRRFAGEGRRVAVPAVTVVVDVDHRQARAPRFSDCFGHPCAALAKRGEQRPRVLVVEVVEDVDDEKRIALLELAAHPEA
jgi:metallophosphoesterase superfamily enzyme